MTDKDFNEITIKKTYPNDDKQETPKDKLNAIRQRIAIYQQQAKELEDQIAHDSKEAHQRFVEAYQELADFAKTVDGLSVELDEQKDIAITYTKDDEQVFKQFYRYNNDFPEKTVDDVKEELTTAIAIIDQLHGKITFKRAYKPKDLFNPFWLADEGILISFNKQEDNTVIEAKKESHTYRDGFVVTLNDTTTLKTYNDVDNDCVTQTIYDTRVITDLNQLYPLLEDVIRNIDSYQSKSFE